MLSPESRECKRFFALRLKVKCRLKYNNNSSMIIIDERKKNKFFFFLLSLHNRPLNCSLKSI